MPKRLLFVLGWLGVFLGFAYWIEPGFWRGADGHYRAALVLAEKGSSAESLEHLDRALRVQPDDPGLLRTRGFVTLELGRFEEARDAFLGSLEAQPDHPDTLIGLAKAQLALGSPKLALAALADLPARMETFELRLERARLLAEAGDLQGAWGRYQVLVREQPEDLVVLEEASALAAMSQKWDDALTLAERLANSAEEQEVRRRAVERMAEAAWASGQPELASHLYRTIPDPDNLEARARLSLELERYEEASDLLAHLSMKDPGVLETRATLAYALVRAGRLEEAEAIYDALFTENPDDQEIVLQYVGVLNQLQRYDRSWEVLATLTIPSPDVQTHWLQAQTAHWAGEAEIAERLLESWSERSPGDPRPYLLLAESRRVNGDREGRIVALERFLDHQVDDLEVRWELANIFAEEGRVVEAILRYREIAELDPGNVEVLTELGILFESIGDHESALRRYKRAADVSATPSDDLLLRLGRVHTWTEDPDGAVPWYEALLARPLAPDERRRATLELSEALLAAGKPAEALGHIEPYAAQDSGDGAAQLVAARASSDLGLSQEAVRYLDRLAEVRELSREEANWLGGQLRASGDPRRVLEVYEGLLARGSDDPELFVAVGDLRLEQDDPTGAMDAYEGIPVSDRPLDAVLGAARASSALGDRPGASILYEQYLSQRPDDYRVRLELARVLMMAGRSSSAVREYEQYVAVRGEEGLGLELARAYLDLQRYQTAAAVALRAEERGERVEQVRLSRAQALMALGEIREADGILRSLVDLPSPADDPTWAARLAEARNQPVRALFEAQAALESGRGPAAELYLLQARALGSRGDVSRTLESLERARESGADTARVRMTLDRLSPVWASELELPLLLQEDDGGLRIPLGGASARFMLANRFRLRVAANLGRIEQRGTVFDRWVMAITMDRWFPAPEIEVGAGIGWESYGADGDLLIGQGSFSRSFGNGAELALRLERSSLWSPHDEFRPRGFNRITDASLLEADFRVHTAVGNLIFRGTSEWESRFEAGVSAFQDGNTQFFAYAHRQIPIVSRAGDWLVLRPNVYFDGFSDEVAGYASPTLSTSLGLSLHGIRDWSSARIEADLNPNLLWVDGEWGPGGSGMLDVSVPMGRVRLGGTVFGYLRGPEDYSLWRLMTRISMPVGGAGSR